MYYKEYFEKFLDQFIDCLPMRGGADFLDDEYIRSLHIYKKGETDINNVICILYNVNYFYETNSSLTRKDRGEELYRVKNISSLLENNKVYTEKELRELFHKDG